MSKPRVPWRTIRPEGRICIQEIWTLIAPTLLGPTFATHLPKELIPLAKLSPDDPAARTKPLRRGEGPTTVEVFECCTGSTRTPRVPARALAGRREAREKPDARTHSRARVFREARNTAREARALPKTTRTIPSRNAPRWNIKPAASSRSWTKTFLVALEHGMPPGGRHRHRH